MSRAYLLPQRVSVAVIGVGGTGGELLSHLTHTALALRALNRHHLHVQAFDPDEVSAANVVRQRFYPADLGQNKARTLVHRINVSSGLDWTGHPRRFDAEDAAEPWDLVISCVDNRETRAALHVLAQTHQWPLWLDCGNGHDYGQVMLGEGKQEEDHTRPRLPWPTEQHPELMDTSVPDDDMPSCSAAEALSKQDLFVNTMTATLAAQLLWPLLKDGQLRHQGFYFNLSSGQTLPLDLPEHRKDVTP